MANEATLFALLAFTKGGSGAKLDLPSPLQATVAGTKYQRTRQTIGITEEALQLGEVASAGGLFCIRNHDAVNFVSIRPATGGTATIRINAGDIALFRWAATVTAPFAIADTAPVDVEFLALPA